MPAIRMGIWQSDCQGRAHLKLYLDETNRLVLQVHLLHRDIAQPAPAGQSSSGSVKHVEVVAIAHARDLTEDATLPEGAGLDIARARYATQVRAVHM